MITTKETNPRKYCYNMREEERRMNDTLSIDKKPEIIEFMNLLDEMNLNADEQKVMLGIIQGVKLAKSMEQYKRSGKTRSGSKII